MEDIAPGPLQSAISRRSALRLLVSAAVLPPVIGAFAEPAAAAAPAAPGQNPLSQPLRHLDRPNLQISKVTTITGQRHRVTFFHARWDGGQTYLREIETQVGKSWLRVTDPAQRFDEQWVVFTGVDGIPADYYSSMTPNWVAFDSLRQLSARTVELRSAAPGLYDLTVRWNLDGLNPELQWTVTAHQDSNYVVGYQSFDPQGTDQIDEVLCGARQHARVINTTESLGAWELYAPMSLTQRRIGDQDITLGVYTPGEVMVFEHERELGPDGQPFGMSLRNDDHNVQPVVYAPQVGRRSPLKAGEKRGYAIGLYAGPGPLYNAYNDLARHEYRYTNYRRNVYDTSLTDTVFNIIDLVMTEPASDDSVTFVPSFGGWWSRAKGFVDIENDQAVRTPTSAVLMSAYLLTGHEGLYDKRARPTLEYHVSRPGVGTTPIKGKAVYGNANLYRIGKIPGDASTLVPLYEQTRGQNAGIHRLAMDMIRQRPVTDSRTPMSTPLQAYVLTGNPAYLAEVRAEARRYIRDQITLAYTTNELDVGFGYNYVKAWTELLVLFELTGEKEFLDASYREAQRYITEIQVRPVPDTMVTVPNQPFIDNTINMWTTPLEPAYTETTVASERVPAWVVSTNGMTFEQLGTFKTGAGVVNPSGGFVEITPWASFLLRLAQHTGDTLLRDVAHNLIVGRFTNYPGYYNRQFSVTQMKPGFPLQGPVGVSSIYYTHIPGQLGEAIDYLVTEQVARSGSRIDFPKRYETNYVYFRFHTYGHASGTFYGEQDVWPYFPKGIVKVANPQLNWLTAVGNNSLYLSLTNEDDHPATATIDLATELTGISRSRSYPLEVIRDNGSREHRTLTGGRLSATVSAKGITAIVVRGVNVSVPWHFTPAVADRAPDSYYFEDLDPTTDSGLVRAMLLVRPDRAGYDAYVQFDTEAPAQLFYAVNGGPEQPAPTKVFPYEWSIPVGALTDTFTYRVVAGSLNSQGRTLRLPPSVTGVCPPGVPACGEVSSAPDTTAGDTFRAQARLRNGTDTALTTVDIVLALPDGWSAVVVGSPQQTVSAGQTILREYDITVPAGAAPASYQLAATASWAGGSTELAGASIEVIAAIKVTALFPKPAVLAKPGDSLQLTAAVLNVGPVARAGTANLTLPAGWTASPAAIAYNVPGRGEVEYTVTVTASAAAVPGAAYRLTASPDSVSESSVTVAIAGTQIVVDNADPWPHYVETGWWLASSLPGYNGTATRYSQQDRLGGTTTWQPDLAADGTYDVAVWYPTNPDTTTAAIYVVHHADGDTELTVNQQENANGWRSLGKFRFTKGSDGYVRIVVRNPGFHRVDAAQFGPVDPATLRPTIEGLQAAAVSAPGAQTTVTATIRAKSDTPVKDTVTVSTPDGWTVSPASIPIDLAEGATTTVSFALTAPATAVPGSQHQVVLTVAGASATAAIAIGAVDPAAFVVVDNDDAGYTEQGRWDPSSLVGFDGGSTRVASGAAGPVATWTPGLPAAGRYQVSVWYPSNVGTTTAAHYTVVAASGEQTVIVDQTLDARTWRSLGFFDLSPATAAVRLSVNAAGFHRADGVRFEPVVAVVG